MNWWILIQFQTFEIKEPYIFTFPQFSYNFNNDKLVYKF